jgi:hypothetical protein
MAFPKKLGWSSILKMMDWGENLEQPKQAYKITEQM